MRGRGPSRWAPARGIDGDATPERIRRVQVTQLEWGASTHIGHTREVNEDSLVAEPPVFVVADGMGGHDRGEVASRILADEFAALSGGELGVDAVAEALQAAHAHIRDSYDEPDERSMGTTLAAAVLVTERGVSRWLIVNVGDSRVYHLSRGELCQLSVDHSAVQELVTAGQITPEAAKTHPDRHVITRAVGIGDTIVADYALRDPVAGERFLLCSDGVHGQLNDGEILAALSAPSPQDAATALVEAVLRGRASDNLTAVVVDVLSVDGGVGDRVDMDHVDEDTSPRDPGVELELSIIAEAVQSDEPPGPFDIAAPPVDVSADLRSGADTAQPPDHESEGLIQMPDGVVVPRPESDSGPQTAPEMIAGPEW